MVILENKQLTLQLSEHGAEAHSLKNKKSGIEYIWNGDPSFWFRHAPILFPLSGPTRDNKIVVEGKEYSLPNNGFARDSEFKVNKVEDDKASFTLEESEETLRMYPFGFVLTVEYMLTASGFVLRSTIESKQDGMHFVYAWHPALNLDINKGADFDSYSITFSEKEHQDRDCMQNKVFVTTKNGFIGNRLFLKRTDTDKGPIILHNVKSRTVRFSSSKGEHGALLDMGELHTLVCWSPEGKNAPFVCVEPMFSFGDSTRDLNIEKMSGTLCLNKGEKKTFTNSIMVF
ncbi:MAG: hypothetical protein WC159_06740 [Sphaerochaetaceae bacterium]